MIDGETPKERHELCKCTDPCPTYECVECKRDVPWCFGAADDLPDHCDDCWADEHVDDDEVAEIFN